MMGCENRSNYIKKAAFQRPIRKDSWLRGRDLNPRPLGYEPTRVLARLFCSIIYVLPVPWFFLLFGRFCGRNVVEIVLAETLFNANDLRDKVQALHLDILTVKRACNSSY